jgi:hypothetical protein
MTNSSELFDESAIFLRELRERLEKECAAMQKRIADVKIHIEELETASRKADRLADRSNGKVRSRKGENARAVAALFAKPDVALTKQEIADRSKIPFTSVLRVLAKDGGYIEGADGLFRRKAPGPQTGPSANTPNGGE